MNRTELIHNRHLPPRPALHRREPVAARPASSSATAPRADALPARRRPRRLPPAPESSAGRHGRLLRAPLDAAPRGADRADGAGGAAPPPPRRADRAVRHRQAADASFPYEHLGVLSPPQLAALYSEATVGLCLSLTNFSLMPKEMLACGLPCVELAGVSAESIFGAGRPARARAARRRSRSRTRSSGCSTTRAERERRSRAGDRVRRLAHLGPSPRRGRGRVCVTRCASARRSRAQP